MQGTLALLLTTVMAASINAAPTSNGRLHIIRVVDNSLEAIFYNADAGIRIIASSLSLSLYSMDGEELLLSGDKPHGSQRKLITCLFRNCVNVPRLDLCE